MKIWEVNVDVEKFASIYLTDNNGEFLSIDPDWSYFDGQIVSANWSIPTAKLQEGKRIGNFVEIDLGILVCYPFAWICL